MKFLFYRFDLLLVCAEGAGGHVHQGKRFRLRGSRFLVSSLIIGGYGAAGGEKQPAEQKKVSAKEGGAHDGFQTRVCPYRTAQGHNRFRATVLVATLASAGAIEPDRRECKRIARYASIFFRLEAILCAID